MAYSTQDSENTKPKHQSTGTSSGSDIDKKGKEGALTKIIEKQTSKIPSGAYLALGVGSIAFSLVAKLTGRSKTANFIGLWVPTILVMGLYNKLVKLEGSDRQERNNLH